MLVKPRIRKTIFTAVIALSFSSFIYVNSQYNICPIGIDNPTVLFQENVKEAEEQDTDFLTLPDMSLLKTAAAVIDRLTRY